MGNNISTFLKYLQWLIFILLIEFKCVLKNSKLEQNNRHSNTNTVGANEPNCEIKRCYNWIYNDFTISANLNSSSNN